METNQLSMKKNQKIEWTRRTEVCHSKKLNELVCLSCAIKQNIHKCHSFKNFSESIPSGKHQQLSSHTQHPQMHPGCSIQEQ